MERSRRTTELPVADALLTTGGAGLVSTVKVPKLVEPVHVPVNKEIRAQLTCHQAVALCFMYIATGETFACEHAMKATHSDFHPNALYRPRPDETVVVDPPDGSTIEEEAARVPPLRPQAGPVTRVAVAPTRPNLPGPLKRREFQHVLSSSSFSCAPSQPAVEKWF